MSIRLIRRRPGGGVEDRTLAPVKTDHTGILHIDARADGWDLLYLYARSLKDPAVGGESWINPGTWKVLLTRSEHIEGGTVGYEPPWWLYERYKDDFAAEDERTKRWEAEQRAQQEAK